MTGHTVMGYIYEDDVAERVLDQSRTEQQPLETNLSIDNHPGGTLTR